MVKISFLTYVFSSLCWLDSNWCYAWAASLGLKIFHGFLGKISLKKLDLTNLAKGWYWTSRWSSTSIHCFEFLSICKNKNKQEDKNLWTNLKKLTYPIWYLIERIRNLINRYLIDSYKDLINTQCFWIFDQQFKQFNRLNQRKMIVSNVLSSIWMDKTYFK